MCVPVQILTCSISAILHPYHELIGPYKYQSGPNFLKRGFQCSILSVCGLIPNWTTWLFVFYMGKGTIFLFCFVLFLYEKALLLFWDPCECIAVVLHTMHRYKFKKYWQLVFTFFFPTNSWNRGICTSSPTSSSDSLIVSLCPASSLGP